MVSPSRYCGGRRELRLAVRHVLGGVTKLGGCVYCDPVAVKVNAECRAFAQRTIVLRKSRWCGFRFPFINARSDDVKMFSRRPKSLKIRSSRSARTMNLGRRSVSRESSSEASRLSLRLGDATRPREDGLFLNFGRGEATAGEKPRTREGCGVSV